MNIFIGLQKILILKTSLKFLNYNAYSSSAFTLSLLVDVVFASFCGMLEIASEDSARKMIHCINSNKFDRKII